jgi:hypothetical protein|tara:strand:- start:461 stop:682 length:222 start_codon:yes stop_codon:yes gene_type:complete
MLTISWTPKGAPKVRVEFFQFNPSFTILIGLEYMSLFESNSFSRFRVARDSIFSSDLPKVLNLTQATQKIAMV